MDISQLDEVQLRSVVELLSKANPNGVQEAICNISTKPDPPTALDIKQPHDESLDPEINDGKVKTQMEVSGRFVDIMICSGKKYRKTATSYIRKAKRGETITTAIFGEKETENTVQNDDQYIVCGQAAFETYILSNKEFFDNYDTDTPTEITLELLPYKNLHHKGFKEYRSNRAILAHRVTNEDMDWFRSGMDKGHNESDSAEFVAPWGERMLVEEGDFLATTYPPDGKGEVYRIETSAFAVTYEYQD